MVSFLWKRRLKERIAVIKVLSYQLAALRIPKEKTLECINIKRKVFSPVSYLQAKDFAEYYSLTPMYSFPDKQFLFSKRFADNSPLTPMYSFPDEQFPYDIKIR